MASDLEQRMSFEEETKNLIGVPECLIHMERRVVLHGAGRVDNPDAIPAELTGYVRPKAHCLVVHFRKEGEVLKRPGYGQVGFIRKDKIQTSPGGTEDFSVVPVTAKHNLRRMDGGKLNAVQAEALIGERHTADFAFDDLNWMSSTTDSVPIVRTERSVFDRRHGHTALVAMGTGKGCCSEALHLRRLPRVHGLRPACSRNDASGLRTLVHPGNGHTTCHSRWRTRHAARMGWWCR